jgi:hypothetical protein
MLSINYSIDLHELAHFFFMYRFTGMRRGNLLRRHYGAAAGE